jgi:hypothetical protein
MVLTDDEALRQTEAFFEELIGCVIGCGCWSPGWDTPAAIASYVATMRASARSDAPDLPSVALAALEHVLAHAEDLYGATQLSFQSAQELRDFFEPARARLEAAILAAP